MLSTTGAMAETLDRFYEDLRGYSASPLWLVQEEALVAEPKSWAWPHRRRWRELRPQALRAGELIGTADAERRGLMLLNPGLDRMATTNSMFAGLQIVMPGEAARAHRHTPAALRFIIESQGGITTVNGDASRCIPAIWRLPPTGRGTTTPTRRQPSRRRCSASPRPRYCKRWGCSRCSPTRRGVNRGQCQYRPGLTYAPDNRRRSRGCGDPVINHRVRRENRETFLRMRKSGTLRAFARYLPSFPRMQGSSTLRAFAGWGGN